MRYSFGSSGTGAYDSLVASQEYTKEQAAAAIAAALANDGSGGFS